MTRRLTLATLAAALLGALMASSAPAKGPIEPSPDGTGLESPLPFVWTHGGAADHPRRAPFEQVALATRLLTAVFADASVETFDAVSRRLRLEPPRGDLGRRYTLTHRFEGPGGREIVQHVYPYAEPSPVLFSRREAGSSRLQVSGKPSSKRVFRLLTAGMLRGSLAIGLAALGAALTAGALLRSQRVGRAQASA